jgi:predicted permease
MVLESLAPVALLIGTGVLAGKLGWVKQAAVKGLTDLVFLLLTPALMFRTMGKVDVRQTSARLPEEADLVATEEPADETDLADEEAEA